MENIMRISDYLEEDFIIDLQSDTKKGALEELLEVICRSPKITNPVKFRKAIFNREKLMSTGIGYHLAVPHARDKCVLDFVIAIGRSKVGIEYESIDDKPVKLVIMIGAPDKQDKDYIKLLSRLVLRLKNPDFKHLILSAANAKEIYDIIQQKK